MRKIMMIGAALSMLTVTAAAGEVEVVDAKVRGGPDSYSFAVTLRHADTGWQHYADRWTVLGPDGAVLGTRVLVHPHVDEQPFTRSLGGVRIPAGVKRVHIRAHDKVHGDSPVLFPLDIR
ncbi:MAG: hypothetical protein ACTSV1_00395 [Alphaproteobacteria bacterium]